MLPCKIYYVSGIGRPPPCTIFEGKSENVQLSEEVLEQNIFLKNLHESSILPLNFPKKTKIQVKNGEVILDHKMMKITIAIMFNQWLRGLDFRINHLLNIHDEKDEQYPTISRTIIFKADFKLRAIFSRKADNYYDYVKKMAENLRSNYGWSRFIENLKEAAYWQHIFPNDVNNNNDKVSER